VQGQAAGVAPVDDSSPLPACSQTVRLGKCPGGFAVVPAEPGDDSSDCSEWTIPAAGAVSLLLRAGEGAGRGREVLSFVADGGAEARLRLASDGQVQREHQMGRSPNTN
jgi:hypothetical protein